MKQRLALNVKLPQGNFNRECDNQNQMLYIADKLDCTEELNNTNKSETKSPTDQGKKLQKEENQFRRIIKELREK